MYEGRTRGIPIVLLVQSKKKRSKNIVLSVKFRHYIDKSLKTKENGLQVDKMDEYIFHDGVFAVVTKCQTRVFR